jgi:hypothetical protein
LILDRWRPQLRLRCGSHFIFPNVGWRREMENVSQFADHQFNTPFADLDNKQSWVGAGEMPPSLGRFKRKYLPI